MARIRVTGARRLRHPQRVESRACPCRELLLVTAMHGRRDLLAVSTFLSRRLVSDPAVAGRTREEPKNRRRAVGLGICGSTRVPQRKVHPHSVRSFAYDTNAAQLLGGEPPARPQPPIADSSDLGMDNDRDLAHSRNISTTRCDCGRPTAPKEPADGRPSLFVSRSVSA